MFIFRSSLSVCVGCSDVSMDCFATAIKHRGQLVEGVAFSMKGPHQPGFAVADVLRLARQINQPHEQAPSCAARAPRFVRVKEAPYFFPSKNDFSGVPKILAFDFEKE